MKESICKKYGIEYTNSMLHMSLNEFVSYMIDRGFELSGLAYNYYKWSGFSDRLAKNKAKKVIESGVL